MAERSNYTHNSEKSFTATHISFSGTANRRLGLAEQLQEADRKANANITSGRISFGLGGNGTISPAPPSRGAIVTAEPPNSLPPHSLKRGINKFINKLKDIWVDLGDWFLDHPGIFIGGLIIMWVGIFGSLFLFTPTDYGSFKYTINQGNNTYYTDSLTKKGACLVGDMKIRGGNVSKTTICGSYSLMERHK